MRWYIRGCSFSFWCFKNCIHRRNQTYITCTKKVIILTSKSSSEASKPYASLIYSPCTPTIKDYSKLSKHILFPFCARLTYTYFEMIKIRRECLFFLLSADIMTNMVFHFLYNVLYWMCLYDLSMKLSTQRNWRIEVHIQRIYTWVSEQQKTYLLLCMH